MLIQIADPLISKKTSEDPIAIGIDFGTTHCVAAYLQEDAIKMIPLTPTGRELLPSIVGIKNGQFTMVDDRTEGIFSIKRLIGRSYEEIRSIHPGYADVIKSSVDGLLLSTELGDKPALELAVVIFRHIKQAAEQHLNQEVTDAVVTVPAYFDDTARSSIRDAAKLAGFNVLRLIAEPTAAAFAYGLDHQSEGNYVVYDLGGGTFDVSILKLTQGVFQVLATGGDPVLGGDDFDEAIVRHFHGEGLAGIDRKRAIKSAQRVKESLSIQAEATFDSYDGGRHTLTQETFERLIYPMISKTGQIVRSTLKDAELSVSDIQGIILVGGSTRIPLVQKYLQEMFQLPFYREIDPDRVVAVGAAYQASALTRGGDNVLVDVTPLSLGIEMMGGVVEKVIHRNTPIPISKTQKFTTFQDNQTGLVLHVLQGERETVEDCRSLGKFILSGIPPMPAGMAVVNVTFTLDADGLLTVSAHEEASGVTQIIQVKPNHGLSEATMAEMILESHRCAERDMFQRLLRQTTTMAQQMISAVQKALEADGELLSETEAQRIQGEIQALVEVLKSEDRKLIANATQRLEQSTKEFAHRRIAKHLKAQVE